MRLGRDGGDDAEESTQKIEEVNLVSFLGLLYCGLFDLLPYILI